MENENQQEITQEMDIVSIKTEPLPLDDDTNKNVVSDVVNEEESKPRIILTLRTNEKCPDAYFSSSNIENNNIDHINHVNSKKKSPKLTDNGIINCVKRTPRRISKDYSRESVLQNAIALKEKSFNLPGNETSRKSKSPKNIKKSTAKTNVCNEIETRTESEISDLSWLGNSVDLFNGINNNNNKNGVLDVKTIRPIKRKRYYKGLTYSFKSRARKRKKQFSKSSHEEITSSEQDTDSQNTIITTYGDESIQGVYSSDSNQETAAVVQNNQQHSSLDAINNQYGNDVPSPSTGDVAAHPAKPESSLQPTKIYQDRLCLCNSNEYVYIKTDSMRVKEQFCQALDTISEKQVGCCNTLDVTKSEIRLRRPSTTIPFLMFCDVHYHRMLIHHCCPVCGLFCTQGRFMMCEFHHLYHKDCELTSNGELICPHCTKPSSSREINIFLGQHKNPVFLPSRKLFKLSASAKMSYRGSKLIVKNDVKDYTKLDTSTNTVVLPSGKEITSNGLLGTTEEEELERHLFSILPECSGSPGHRYTYRSMYHAAKTGDVEKLIGCIAAGLNPNHLYREWTMGSALHAAASAGFVITVHILVQAGAQLDVLDRELNTPLMLSVLNNHNDAVKYLVKAGASVDFKGTDGMTALHLAAKSGNLEACYYLLPNTRWSHYFVNYVDDGGWTALVWAAEHNHLDIVLFLLSRRADPKIRDVEQNVALHWSAFSGSVEITEALLHYNSDVNSINSHGDTPLHICARKDMYSCVVLLLARGARTDVKNNAGLLPLDSCVMEKCNSYNVIKLSTQLRMMISSNCSERTLRILNNDITKGYEKNPIQCVNGIDDEGEPKDFTYITENCFTSNISIDRTITSLQCCTCEDGCNTISCNCNKLSIRCWYAEDAKLSTDFNYADPPLLFECNQLCKCNKLKCNNRVIQAGVTGRFQLFRTKDKGWGVNTLKTIHRGTYVCEYIGEIISDIEADTRADDSYLFDLDNRDGETYCIDACRYGNIARFINHNCEPNLLPVRVFINHQDLHFPRIAFFANKDISANEELGFDYGEKFWQIKYKTFTCTCGANICKYSTTTIESTLQAYNLKVMAEHEG